MGILDNNVAVITGAGSGLGREYAYYLSSLGASIVVNDFGATVLGEHEKSNSADTVMNEIISRGGTAVANTEGTFATGMDT